MSASARGRAALLLVLILLAGAALRSLDMGDPWSGRGFKSAFGTYTTGAYARNFYEHGFLESGFMPFAWRIELADGTVHRNWYAHHPALYAVLSGAAMRVFGPHEWAVKLPWLLLSILAIWSCHRLFRAIWGERAALLGAFFLAVAPLSAWWATLPWTDGAVTFLYGLIGTSYLRWLRHGERRGLYEVSGLLFVGGLLDWSALLILPGLGLHAAVVAWRRSGVRGILPLLWMPAAAIASVGLHKLHMLLVMPAEVAFRDTSSTLADSMRNPKPWAEFFRLQGIYYFRYLTYGLGALVLGGLALEGWRAVRGRLTAERALLFVLLLPGPIYVLLFPGRSVNHDFFLHISMPCFAAAAALLVDEAWTLLEARLGRSTFARRVAAVAILGLVAFLGARCVWRTLQIWTLRRSDVLERVVASDWMGPLLQDPSAVLITSSGYGQSFPYYSRAPVLGEINEVDVLQGMRDHVFRRLGPDRRVVYVFDLNGIGVFADLYAYLKASGPSEQHLELLPDRVALELFDLTDWALRDL